MLDRREFLQAVAAAGAVLPFLEVLSKDQPWSVMPYTMRHVGLSSPTIPGLCAYVESLKLNVYRDIQDPTQVCCQLELRDVDYPAFRREDAARVMQQLGDVTRTRENSLAFSWSGLMQPWLVLNEVCLTSVELPRPAHTEQPGMMIAFEPADVYESLRFYSFTEPEFCEIPNYQFPPGLTAHDFRRVLGNLPAEGGEIDDKHFMRAAGIIEPA